ncbi:hypothetical protein ElyMa_001371800 [Elysia marginata]|uniref:Uncharacterized protein n=1 Tax=Elysia marginata TaxID=1093978 RepID=A0AAV4ISV6_9GAST|nr:hypothetical protein ElyMa_001371800 [Elysia marginata]
MLCVSWFSAHTHTEYNMARVLYDRLQTVSGKACFTWRYPVRQTPDRVRQKSLFHIAVSRTTDTRPSQAKPVSHGGIPYDRLQTGCRPSQDRWLSIYFCLS